MPSSSHSTTSNDECEHCHSTYNLIKRKKNCAICQQSYCTNCAPRKTYDNHSCRICIICQLISSNTATNDQLLELKVKHLRYYLQAKDIPHHTCTEKQELVDLIVRNRHLPFTRLSSQQNSSTTDNNNQQQQQARTTSTNSSSSTTMQPPPKPNNNSGPFTNFQHTVSSFANQMNNFASNLQDYVANTVTGVINTTVGDEQQEQQSTTSTNNNPNGATSFNFGTTFNGTTGGPFNYSYSSSGNSAHASATANSATTNSQQQRRPPPSSTAAAASTNSSTNQRIRRKSLSDIRHEDNIEDLNIRELKEILAANFVDFKGCVEKNELIDKVRRLYRDRQNEQLRAKDLGDSAASDSELCKICMDAIADCVFLDCGHMVTCVKCGKLLAECPICRSNIVRVVRVFKS